MPNGQRSIGRHGGERLTEQQRHNSLFISMAFDIDSIHIHKGNAIPVGLNPQANKFEYYGAKKTSYVDVKKELVESKEKTF